MNPRILSTSVCLVVIVILHVTNQVSSNFLSKYFSKMQGPDNMFTPNICLLERFTEHRFRCLSSCIYQCNMAVYNANTTMCRLHQYIHFIPSEPVTPDPQSQHYGESCHLLYEAPCNSSNGPIPVCHSCLQLNTWTYAATPCSLYASSRNNLPDGSTYVDLPFNMTSDMKIVANFKSANLSRSAMVLEEHRDNSLQMYTGIDVSWSSDTVSSFIKDGPGETINGIPISDPSNYTLELLLLKSGISMFADGVHLKTFNKTFTGLNRIAFQNQRDIFNLHVIKLPESCN